MDIFINFKNYSSGIGQKQRELLDFLESLSISSFPYSLPTTTYNLVVPPTELSPIWQRYNFPLWSEHCDPVKTSRATGWVSAEQIKEAGGIGTMLNHSEHRLPFNVIKETTEICHEHDLKVLICCQNEKEAILYSSLQPEYIAFEPPELIANKRESVISKSEEIKKIVNFLSNRPSPAIASATAGPLPTTLYNLQPTTFLIGAGIRSHKDISQATKLGAQGILIASSIMEGSKEEIKKLLI